jgi:ABC-type transport system involved in cytochrome c biogenesis permease component
MVSAVTAAGVAVIVLVHTAIAAVGARYFRITLSTRWGSVLYTVVLIPLVYVVTTLALGALGLGSGAFDDAGQLIVVTWAFPFFLGWSIDLFWIPAPEELEDVPDRTDD